MSSGRRGAARITPANRSYATSTSLFATETVVGSSDDEPRDGSVSVERDVRGDSAFPERERERGDGPRTVATTSSLWRAATRRRLIFCRSSSASCESEGGGGDGEFRTPSVSVGELFFRRALFSFAVSARVAVDPSVPSEGETLRV